MRTTVTENALLQVAAAADISRNPVRLKSDSNGADLQERYLSGRVDVVVRGAPDAWVHEILCSHFLEGIP